MAILATDIKLLESERMRDTADGGGRQTANIVPSGTAGNVFPKVSRVDSVYGRVNLRKLYAAVRTATLDIYAGAHAIITDPPDNDRISVTLFSTGSAFDTRTEARDRIESYVVAGPFSRLRLYGNQLVGQKAILTYQRDEEPLPDVGDVLVLSYEPSGTPVAQQYVRIADVSHEVRTFTDSQGDYTRRVVTLKIGSALSQTFTGAEPSRYSTDTSPTKIRVTQVADASTYYGIAPLAQAAAPGDLVLDLPSIYAPLVPSTQRETPISLAEISGAGYSTAAGAERDFPLDDLGFPSGYPSPPAVLHLPVPVQYLDIKLANVVLPRIAPGGSAEIVSLGIVVTLDEAGLTLTRTGQQPSSMQYCRYKPAAQTSVVAHNHEVAVTLATRGSVYSESLSPLPAPGTLVVDFRALGKWYRLRDNGAGELQGNDPAEGTGSVDYVTGAVVVTLGSLPDVDSSILFAWGSPTHFTVRAGGTSAAATSLRYDYTLVNTPIIPATLVATYNVNGVPRNATDSGGTGTITGTGVTGTINYATGQVSLLFTSPPDRASTLSSAYQWRDAPAMVASGSPTLSGGQFTMPGTAPYQNSGSMQLLMSMPASSGVPTVTVSASISAAGAVVLEAGQYGQFKWAQQTIGTFALSTGVVTISSQVVVVESYWAFMSWQTRNLSRDITAVVNASAEQDKAHAAAAVTGETVAVNSLQFDLATSVSDRLLPGSLYFRVCGKNYADRNGTIYTDHDRLTGSALAAGTVDYGTGLAQITYWANNAAASPAVYACLTQYGDWTAVEAHFRTPGSPIRPASLFVQVTAIDGGLLTGTADTNGVITGAAMRGTVNQEMGVVSVEFGELVLGSWESREVVLSTLRFNAVVLSNLPLDASILGLDPVRLPSDGRVTIFRPADVVVVHSTQSSALTNPVVASTTYSVGRTDCAVIRLTDANGADIAADRYTVDLVAGEVTMASDWDGTGVAEPLQAIHRIEEMALLADVQINGQISLSGALTRTYPLPGSYVSSALLFGDLQAVVSNVFDQQTWTSVWSDALIGSQATAQYDDINHPIEVLNESAVTERWRINFTSSTAFQVIGENLGVIATGNTTTDAAPLNPVTSEPYFVLRAAGWGAGWATGNNLRFNTIGASGPIWAARTILAGASLAGDSFDLEARGDVD